MSDEEGRTGTRRKRKNSKTNTGSLDTVHKIINFEQKKNAAKEKKAAARREWRKNAYHRAKGTDEGRAANTAMVEKRRSRLSSEQREAINDQRRQKAQEPDKRPHLLKLKRLAYHQRRRKQAQSRQDKIFQEVSADNIAASHIAKFRWTMSKRKPSKTQSATEYDNWVRRTKTDLLLYSKAKVRELSAWLRRCTKYLPLQAKLEKRGLLKEKNAGVGEDGGLSGPKRARKSAAERDRDARRVLSDQAATVLIYQRFGKRGLKKRHSKGVLELTRVIKVMEASKEWQQKRILRALRRLRARFMASKDAGDLNSFFTGPESRIYHTKTNETADSRRSKELYTEYKTLMGDNEGGEGREVGTGGSGDEDDGEEPDAEEERGQSSSDEGIPPSTLVRACDAGCAADVAQDWPPRLQKILHDLTSASPVTALRLDPLVKKLVEVEECGKCEDELAGGCYPTRHCEDSLRWLRQSVAPHFACVRTILRQIYKLRQHVQWLVDVEQAFAWGDVHGLLRLYKAMGSPGAARLDPHDADDDGADDDIGSRPENELLGLLRPVMDEFHTRLDDLPTKVCDICLERKSVSELKAGITRDGKRIKFGADSTGAPVFWPLEDDNLAHLHNFFCYAEKKELRLCLKCYAKMKRTGDLPVDRMSDQVARELARALKAFRDKGTKPVLGAGGVGLTEADFRHLPQLSIFNNCLLDPIPPEINALKALGPYHVNLPLSGTTAFPQSALKGHQVIYPMGVEENLTLVSEAHKVRLPSGKFSAIVLNRFTKSVGAAKAHLLHRKEVSRAIEYFRHNHPDYANVENAWLEEDERWIADAEVLEGAGLEVEDDPDGVEIIQLGEAEDQELLTNLQHVGHTGDVPFTASALIEEALRTAKTDLEVFKEDRVQATPLAAYDKTMEYKPFPELYPRGRFGLAEGRFGRVSEAAWVKHQLKLNDPRFAESKEWMFSMTSRKTSREISAAAFASTRVAAWSKGTGNRVTVASVKKDLELLKPQELNKRLDLVFRNVKGTASYWSAMRSKAFAMLGARGEPSLFVTISNADYDSAHLRKYLCALPSSLRQLDSLSLGYLLNANPVAPSQYYKKRTDLILKLLLYNNEQSKAQRKALREYLATVNGLSEEEAKAIRWPNEEPESDDHPGWGDDDEDEDEATDRALAQKATKGVGIFGVVLDFLIRLEYQNRGAAHLHIQIWIEHCPTIHLDPPEKVIRWVKGRMTARLPDFDESPQLHRLVSKYQVHQCRPSCQTSRRVPVKTKGGNQVMRWKKISCKSGFEKKVSGTFRVNDPEKVVKDLMKTGLRTDLVELPRRPNETRVNQYNPILLLAAASNVDVRIVKDKNGHIAYYITKYQTKEEKDGNVADVMAAINQEKAGKSFQSKVMSVGHRLTSDRPMGEQQAVDFLLAHPLWRMSATTKYLGLGRSEDRRRVMRPQAQLDLAIKEGREDSSAVYDNDLDVYYPRRGEDLEDVCLHEIVSCYDRKTQTQFHKADSEKRAEWSKSAEANSDGYFYYHKRRKTQLVLVTRPMKFSEKWEMERACWDLLQLFHPYRDEAELTSGFPDVAEAFKAREEEMKKRGMEKFLRGKDQRLKLEETLQRYRDEVERELMEAAEMDAFDCDPEAQGAEDLFDDAGALDYLTGDALAKTKNILNDDQRVIFCQVVDVVRHRSVHLLEDCPWPGCSQTGPVPPLRKVILGGAGVGKSLLIAAITGQVNQDFLFPGPFRSVPVDSSAEKDLLFSNEAFVKTTLEKAGEDVVQLMGPTGVSAFLIGGQTVHRSLKVPVQTTGDRRIGRFDLKGPFLKQMKEKWRPKRLLICDEISMVQAELFCFMSHRLGEVFGNKEPFGDVSIVCVGDLFQLPPVNGLQTWKTINGLVYGKRVSHFNLWQLFSVSLLSKSMRAKTDEKFCQVQDRIALGNADDDVLKVLDSRRIFKDQDYEFPSALDRKKHQESKPFKFQKLPSTLKDFRLEDSLSESEFLWRSARWAFDWEQRAENKAEGREMMALFPRTRQAALFAERMMTLEGLSVVTIPAIDKPLGRERNSRLTKKQAEAVAKIGDTQGLETSLGVAVGARVMIRKNLNDRKGLINGARGKVERLEMSAMGERVEFVHVRLNETKKLEKVKRTKAVFKLHDGDPFPVSREQFPLILAYGMSCHKAQGATIPYVLVDLGHLMADCAALAYVAVTRPRRLEDLYVARLHPGVIACHTDAVQETNRIRNTLSLPNVQQFNCLSKEHPDARKLVYKHLPTNDSLNILGNVVMTPKSNRTAFKKPGRPVKGQRTSREASQRSATADSRTPTRDPSAERRQQDSRARRRLQTQSPATSSASSTPQPSVQPKVSRTEQTPTSAIHPTEENTFVRLIWENNSCYLNTSLQMLFAIPRAVEALSRAEAEGTLGETGRALMGLWRGRESPRTSVPLRRALAKERPHMAADLRNGVMEDPASVLQVLIQNEAEVPEEGWQPLLPPALTTRFRSSHTMTVMKCLQCPDRDEFWRQTESTAFSYLRLGITQQRSTWAELVGCYGTEAGPVVKEAESVEVECAFGCRPRTPSAKNYTKHVVRDHFWLDEASAAKDLLLVELPLQLPDGTNVRESRAILAYQNFPVSGQRHKVLAASEMSTPNHFVAYSALPDSQGFLCIDDTKEQQGRGARPVNQLPLGLRKISALIFAPLTTPERGAEAQVQTAEDFNERTGDVVPVGGDVLRKASVRWRIGERRKVQQTIRKYEKQTLEERRAGYLCGPYKTIAQCGIPLGRRRPWQLMSMAGDGGSLEVEGLVHWLDVDGEPLRRGVLAAACPDLQAEFAAMGQVAVGSCRVTHGYALPAHWLLHTAIGTNRQLEHIGQAMTEALNVAELNRLQSLAVPFPTANFAHVTRDLLLQIIRPITQHLKNSTMVHDDDVVLSHRN